MFIKIDLKTDQNYLREFPIALKDIEEVVKKCYLGLGTPYQPIPADSFVSLGNNQFPNIPANAKITIELCPKSKDDQKFKLSDPKIICCKIKNVGREFNDKDIIGEKYWETIFDCDSKYILCAPEGTLYVAPNKKNSCSIVTKNNFPDTFVAYSIIFSLIIEHNDGYKRRYYFILDPVVRIRSTPGN